MRDAFDEMTELGVTVFGLSTDQVEKQKKFHTKNMLPHDLISDRKGKLAKQLGVPLLAKKMTARRAFLFKGGKLVWKDEKGSTAKQGADLLKAIKEAS